MRATKQNNYRADKPPLLSLAVQSLPVCAIQVRALEFYSGIGTTSLSLSQHRNSEPILGGFHVALSRSTVEAEVVRAFDWDQTACAVYCLNHGKGIAHKVV